MFCFYTLTKKCRNISKGLLYDMQVKVKTHVTQFKNLLFSFILKWRFLCVSLVISVARILKKWINQPYDCYQIRQRDLHSVQTLLARPKIFRLTVQDYTVYVHFSHLFVLSISDSYRITLNVGGPLLLTLLQALTLISGTQTWCRRLYSYI